MSKIKQDYLHELALIAFLMDDKAKLQDERTKKMKRMATLARDRQKNSQEFKRLEMEFSQPTVIDFGNEMFAMRRVVKQLRRYKID